MRSKRNRLCWAFLPILFLAAVVFLLNRKVPAQPVVRSFPAAGIERVIMRAAQARGARVVQRGGAVITVSGIPVGGAEGYHGGFWWRPTPARKWGMDFVAKRYGSALVISAKNEILFIHHYYGLDRIVIQVPPGVKVIREELERNGEGKADLSAPTPRP